MRHQWNPAIVLARDQALYRVLTLIGTGRGWCAKMHVTPMGTKTVIVEDLPLPEGWRPLGANQHYVRIVSGGDVFVRSFAKRPYVRNDGSFNVLGASYVADERLLDHYGVFEGKCVIYAPKKYLVPVDQAVE